MLVELHTPLLYYPSLFFFVTFSSVFIAAELISAEYFENFFQYVPTIEILHFFLNRNMLNSLCSNHVSISLHNFKFKSTLNIEVIFQLINLKKLNSSFQIGLAIRLYLYDIIIMYNIIIIIKINAI